MLKTYRIIPLVFILFLFGFSLGIPSQGFTQTLHTSTYTPNIAVGPHLHRAMSTGGGNGDYILYGRDKTQDWCERLLFKETSDLRLGVEVIHIQYSKQFCYYYGAETAGAKNAGVGGPHIWTYALSPLYHAISSCKAHVDKHIQQKHDGCDDPYHYTYNSCIRDLRNGYRECEESQCSRNLSSSYLGSNCW
jgi:hypothetical protein